MRKLTTLTILAITTLIFASCGGGGGAPAASSGTSTITALSAVPDIKDIISSSVSDASISSLKAVSGTPPLLSAITNDNADAYFWGGLLAELEGESSPTEVQREAFWNGEGACRNAQVVGFSFSEIMMNGTSLCYMKNLPLVDGGFEVVSGSVPVPSEIFDVGAGNKLVKINVPAEMSGGPEGFEAEAQDIFIKVYGSGSSEASAGFAADLVFCADGGGTPTGYEKIRQNTSANTITHTTVNTSFGQFASVFTSKTKDVAGVPSIDRTKAQEVTMSMDGTFGTREAYVGVVGNYIVTKEDALDEMGGEAMNPREMYIISGYSGTSPETLKFRDAGYYGQNTGDGFTDVFSGSIEYQNSRYVEVGSAGQYWAAAGEETGFDTGLVDAAGDPILLTFVNEYDLAGDTFYSGAPAIDATLIAAISNYSCSETPDVELNMLATEGTAAVQEECEVVFTDVDFCDSEAIWAIRETMWSGEYGGGEIPDVTGTYGGDPSCINDTKLIPTEAENTYDMNGSTLVMTGESSCTLSLGELDIPCSYDPTSRVFTLDLTSILECIDELEWERASYCGDRTCDLDEGENTNECTDDCDLIIEDLDFIAAYNPWGATEGDTCLEGLGGADDIEFSHTPGGSLPPESVDQYAKDFGGTVIYINREDDNECAIAVGPIGSNSGCQRVVACDETSISGENCGVAHDCTFSIAPVD